MASELRVNKLTNRSGLGTVTYSDTGAIFTGIITATSFSGPMSGTTGTFTGDVSIADKIVHTGDTNTALRFPAADTITAETAGSERLRITSDGRIGINDSSPSDFELDIQNRSGVQDVNLRLYNSDTTSTSDTIMRYQIGGTTANNYIYFGDSGDSNAGQIRYSHSNDFLSINTNAAERLRITSAGKVVIGDTNSDSLFGVYRASHQVAEFTNTNADATGAELTLRKDSSSPADGDSLGLINFTGDNDAGEKVLYSYIQSKSVDVSDGTEDGSLYFYTRGAGTLAERVRIHNDGQVTIGNDHSGAGSWDGDLVVANTNGGRITVGDTGSGEKFSIAANGDINLYSYLSGDNINFHTTDGSGTANRLRIASDGKMGLGTNSPTALLHVSGGSSPAILNKPTDATPALFIGDSNRTSDGQHLAEYRGLWNGTLVSRMVFSAGDDTTNKDNGNIDFYTAAAGTTNLRLRITPGGEVLAGGVTDSVTVSGGALPFQVRGSGGYTGASLIRTSAAGAQLQFAAGSSGNNIADNTGLGYIKFFGYHTNGYDESARIHAEIDGTPGDGDAPGALVFSTTNDGASSPTERARFTSGDQLLINRTTSIHSEAKLEIQGGTQHGESNYIQTWKGNSDDIAVRNMSDGDYEITNSQNGNQMSLFDGSGGARFEYYDNGNWMGMHENYAASNRAYGATNSGSANLVVTSQGYIRRSTSSRRYKDNIREYVGVGVSAIKQIVPKLWEDHVEGSTKLGFIAEDIHSIGLTNAVEYEPYIGGSEIGIGVTYGDMYGNGTTPVTKTGEALDDEVLVVDGIDNTAIIAELVLAIKQLTARVEELESGG